jgi:hypothetical protein
LAHAVRQHHCFQCPKLSFSCPWGGDVATSRVDCQAICCHHSPQYALTRLVGNIRMASKELRNADYRKTEIFSNILHSNGHSWHYTGESALSEIAKALVQIEPLPFISYPGLARFVFLHGQTTGSSVRS